MQITFLGATGTVTGSRYLLECADARLMIDCGLFQGYKQLRLKNWSAPPFDPRAVNAVVLTHAHIDHSGYLPLLAKRGFSGKIHAAQATLELCRILLPDSGYLQEEQARFANRHGFSKHSPALALYTEKDARRCLRQFEGEAFDTAFMPCPDVTVRLSHAGHLPGAASVHVTYRDTSILFSGDLGRPGDALMRAPSPPPACDYLVIESTYGDRTHPQSDPAQELAVAINRAVANNGMIVVPTFAVGRAQLLLLLIARLKAARLIADVPVYLDSPMAIDTTELFQRFAAEHRLSAQECALLSRSAQLTRTADQSRSLDALREPAIILAASGMATGGRVVHHLKTFLPDARNLILLTGFQAGGTRGAALAAGAQRLRIHGQDIPVRAEVVQLSSMSAHADATELIEWLRKIPNAPKQIFITHGEPAASDALRQRIEDELRWPVTVPEYRDVAVLS